MSDGRVQLPAAVLFAATCAGVACGGEVPEPRAPLEVAFTLTESAFVAPPPTPDIVPFDLVAADMDLDGDPDLLVNWHNLAPLELFENRGGEFVLLNTPGDDRSGLFENVGVASLYADTETMLERVRAHGGTGVFVWHEPSPRGDWHVYANPEGTMRLGLRANKPLTATLDARFVSAATEFDARLAIDEPVHFQVGFEFVATQLAMRASQTIYAGSELAPLGNTADLWKDDPHGIAWVNVRSTPEPEIYVTRGGLQGTLVPPFDPKVDRFYEYMGGTPRYLDVRDLVPPEYGRGRRLEWVDVDGDGTNELYIGNTGTPNALLALAGSGGYEDIAGPAGLDLETADAFAWMDVDGDGRDDLVFVDHQGFAVAHNRGERLFEIRRGDQSGLVFPAGSIPTSEALFGPLALHVLDVDNDGRLDLWLAGHGAERRHAVYRGADGGFVEATAELGLSEAPLANRIVFLDRENDGYLDAMTFGVGATWLLNRQGRFEVEPVDPDWGLREFHHAAAVDVDGDGDTDLPLVGHRRLLLRNDTTGGGMNLAVTVTAPTGDPVGTLVIARYASGMAHAQRYGSALSTKYSQGVMPLSFGIPGDDAIEAVDVRWPDGRTESRSIAANQSAVEFAR